MKQYNLYKKLYPSISKKDMLTVPRVISIYQSCIKHEIQDCLINRLHFNDLYVLIMSLDIREIKEVIKQKRRDRMKSKGVDEVTDLTPEEAVKMRNR